MTKSPDDVVALNIDRSGVRIIKNVTLIDRPELLPVPQNFTDLLNTQAFNKWLESMNK